MFVLCKNGDNHYEWYALSASPDKGALDAEAEKRNVAEYETEHAAWLARGKTGPYTMALADPARNGYRTFFVADVPDWPNVDEA